MKTPFSTICWFKSIVLFAVLSAASLASSISARAAISGVSVSDAPANQVTAQVQFSAGVPEILKMVDAKVEGSVITAYIETSPTAYNPSASEIIMLNDRGVPSEVISAMLKHGSEMRARAMATAPPPPEPNANAIAPYTENPGYSYAPPATYSDYGYPSSSVYYSYNYAYPYYGYSYPWYGYGPTFSFGYYPYHHYYHRYPYNSFGHYGYGNHFTAYRGTTRFNGGFNRFPTHGSGFRAVGSTRAPVVIGSHSGGFRGGSFSGGSYRGGSGFTAHSGGGSFRGGGGFSAHGGGGGHMGGRGR